jgi:hypothetical protein
MDGGTVIVSALGSLAGGWLGVTLAVRRLRAEKAFERQLQWHEDMADILYRLAVSVNQWTAPDVGQSREVGHKAYLEFDKQLDRFAVDAQKAALYATKASRARISKLIEELQAVTAEMNLLGEMTPERNTDALKRYRTFVAPIRDTAKVLARDVRRQLGIDTEDRWPIVRVVHHNAKADEP